MNAPVELGAGITIFRRNEGASVFHADGNVLKEATELDVEAIRNLVEEKAWLRRVFVFID